MIEQGAFRVRVRIKGSPRELRVRAPGILPWTSVARAVESFAEDTNVQADLLGMKKNTEIKIITTQVEGVPKEIVGISISNHRKAVTA